MSYLGYLNNDIIGEIYKHLSAVDKINFMIIMDSIKGYHTDEILMKRIITQYIGNLKHCAICKDKYFDEDLITIRDIDLISRDICKNCNEKYKHCQQPGCYVLLVDLYFIDVRRREEFKCSVCNDNFCKYHIIEGCISVHLLCRRCKNIKRSKKDLIGLKD